KISLYPNPANGFGYKISLYPNPANGFVFINNITDYSDINLSILDVTGKVVYQNSFQVDDSKLQVDLPTHQPGLYLVKITVDNNTFSEKLEIR
ncbi:MAG: T9SS type A sorting domain-containing protein, partial [Saprospiraceae bacterium]|nr:T9SS type A sorting domain-containing protein [Saprospiraceae bacterium]